MDATQQLVNLHPVLSALVWSVKTLRLTNLDIYLANDLKDNQSEWEKLNPSQHQWIDMLIGSNLSSYETRLAANEVLISELPELEPEKVVTNEGESHGSDPTSPPKPPE